MRFLVSLKKVRLKYAPNLLKFAEMVQTPRVDKGMTPYPFEEHYS